MALNTAPPVTAFSVLLQYINLSVTRKCHIPLQAVLQKFLQVIFYKIEKLLFLIFVNFPVGDYFVHSDLVVYR